VRIGVSLGSLATDAGSAGRLTRRAASAVRAGMPSPARVRWATPPHR